MGVANMAAVKENKKQSITVQRNGIKFAEQRVKTSEIAAIFGKSTVWINQLVKENVLKKEGRGNFALGETVQTYIDHITGASKDDGKPSKSDFDRDIAEIKRDKQRLELEEMRGNLHNAEDIKRVMGDMIYTTKSKLQSLPSRIANQLEHEPADVIEKALRLEMETILRSLTTYSPSMFSEKDGEDNEED